MDNNLNILPVDKSVVFYTPIQDKNDILVRTGTIGEGSCFFHSILHASSRDYVSMNIEDRIRTVSRIRKNISKKINREKWEQLGDGTISSVSFQETVSFTLNNFFRYVLDNGAHRPRGHSTRKTVNYLINNNNNIELYRVIIALIPLNIFETQILPKAYTGVNSIKKYIENIISDTILYLKSTNEIKSISEEKANYIVNSVHKLLETLLTESEKFAFKKYIHNLKDITEDIDTYTIELISERFNRDIYFIDGNTRLPYNNFSTSDLLRGRKSLIILWNNNHYEIIGRLLSDNKIQREFDPDEHIIMKLKTFLLNPGGIKELYPEMQKYLPSSYQNH